MLRPDSSVIIAGVRIPAMVLGLVISITIHAGLLSSLACISADRAPLNTTDTIVEFALGEPIQVFLVDAPEHSDETAAAPSSDDAVSENLADANDSAAPASSDSVAHDEPALTPSAEAADLVTLSEPLQRPDWSALAHQLDDWRVLISQATSSVTAALRATQPARVAESAPIERDTDASEAVAPPNGRSVVEDSTSSRIELPVRRVEASPVKSTGGALSPGIQQGVSSLNLAPPVYPTRAIRLGLQGTALVEVEVLDDGSVGEIRLRESSGHTVLDEAAMRAARSGRFRPAMRDGEAVNSLIIIPFRFVLRE
jgi:TonB family protein